VLIIKRSDCINTASGTVFSVSDCPVCRLRRNWLGWVGVLFESTVPSQPAHWTVTYREYFTRCCINQFLLNLHTVQSLTENTLPDAVLVQFDPLMMSTELLETCRGL
jgi:hypothetical protein